MVVFAVLLSACGAVTDVQLAAITDKLVLSLTSISSVLANDFSSLTGLTALGLSYYWLSALLQGGVRWPHRPEGGASGPQPVRHATESSVCASQ